MESARFPRQHEFTDCATGETWTEQLADEHVADWRLGVARADIERLDAVEAANRKAAALELVKAKAASDPHFAALLELLT
jgi:hypothetical protein